MTTSEAERDEQPRHRRPPAPLQQPLEDPPEGEERGAESGSAAGGGVEAV